MGTKQSHMLEHNGGRYDEPDRKPKHKTPGVTSPTGSRGKVHEKPRPPGGVPIISDITHNSLALSWQSPKATNGGRILAYAVMMHDLKERRWITLTFCCQGNNYLVKNLEPNSSYQFRVSAENVFGSSKPGRCSEIVQTNNFNFQKFQNMSPEKTVPSIQRRHSVNIKVESRVANILNHSDPVVKTSLSSSVLVDKSFNREIGFRSSLQTNRKRSVNSLLPGSNTDSLLRLKDSRKQPHSNKSSTENINKSSFQESSIEKCSTNINRSVSQESSMEKCETESNTDQSVASSNMMLSCHSQNGDFDELDNFDKRYLENESETSSGDIKMCLTSVDPDSVFIENDRTKSCRTPTSDKSLYLQNDESSPRDFRTLRSMLKSSDIIIKSSRSLPEISDVYKTNGVAHKLSTIIDEDMDDESVRVTTL